MKAGVEGRQTENAKYVEKGKTTGSLFQSAPYKRVPAALASSSTRNNQRRSNLPSTFDVPPRVTPPALSRDSRRVTNSDTEATPRETRERKTMEETAASFWLLVTSTRRTVAQYYSVIMRRRIIPPWRHC